VFGRSIYILKVTAFDPTLRKENLMSLTLTETTSEQERDVDDIYESLIVRFELDESDFTGKFETVAA
jgi:restriction endonuclease Mrr